MLGKHTPTEGRPPEQTHHNFASVQPTKHPLDLSSRNRNLSLNDLAHSPNRVTKLKESLRDESVEQGGRELRKLRMRVDELEGENMTLHKLIIEYEQEMRDWQEKASRLNEQLIAYENRELTSRPILSHYPQGVSNEQELKELKNTISLLEQANRLHTRSTSDLSTQLQASRRELQASRRELTKCSQIQMLFHRMQSDYQQAQLRLERQQQKLKQSESYVEQLELQLEFMSRELTHKISCIEKQTIEAGGREKKQYSDEMQRIQRLNAQLQKKWKEQQAQKEALYSQNRELRVQIQKLLQSKSHSSTETQQLYEQMMRLKQRDYQMNRNSQEETLQRDKQQTSIIASLSYQNSNLKALNERLSAAIQQKIVQIEGLERNMSKINENSVKMSKIEQEKIVARSQIFKQTHEKNSIYREQIRKLTLHNELTLKQMKEIEAYYKSQVSRLKNEAKNQSQIENSISDMKIAHQREKEEIMRVQQCNKKDIKQLERILHEQENHLQSIHAKYCAEVDKLMSENVSLRGSLEDAENYRLQERQQSENKIKEYKEYSYTASKLKGEIDQLTFQLKQQTIITSQLQHQKNMYQQQCEIANSRMDELTSKIKGYQLQIDNLIAENQMWKAYRLSQEDDARRETRKYKKKVEQLEFLLQKQTENNAITDLEQFQKTIQNLKQEMLHRQIQSNALLQAQRHKLNQAMDQITKEMHNILQECDSKIIQKQAEINLLHNKNIELTAMNQQLKLLEMKAFSGHQQLEQLNDKLQKELLAARNDAVRLQTLLKKQQSDNLALKYSSEAQKEIRNRYDKDMESKVTQIQRLKLQIAQITDQLQRKSIASKKQIQELQISLKNTENELKQAQGMNNYLQNMTNTYKSENKQYKQMFQKEKTQKMVLQTKIDQLTGQLSTESFKLNRLREEKVKELQEYQFEASEWKQKWELSFKQNRKLQSKMSGINRQYQNRDVQISQLQRQLVKMKSQFEDARQKCEWLQERLSQSTRDGSQLKDIRQSVADLQQKQASYQFTIDSQKQKIQALSKDQSEKMREIQILIQKIDKMQADLKVLSAHLQMQARNKAKRVDCYHNICNLHLASSHSNKLIFDNDEELFLKIVSEYLKTFNNKLNQAIEDLAKQKHTILQLSEEKENLNGKYLKYKAVAIEYKNRREAHKQLARNTYRFNEQILSHCQNIIKGDPKR